MYGVMDDVFQFAKSFKEFPPRSTPPSFNPATILEGTLREIKIEQRVQQLLPLPAAPEKPK